ncbi:MAG: endonuclease domain-containing protein [Mycobacteriales bacterium]
MAIDVLLRPDFLARLGGRRAADAALGDGTWQRVLRGTYAPAGELDLELRCRAAQLLLPDSARVADRCLLWLLGVDVLPPGLGPPVLEVVVPRGTVVPRITGVRARVAAVPRRDAEFLSRNRLPCLRPVRAAADLLRRLPLAEAVVVSDAVRHAALCSDTDLRTELALHAGLRGVRQAHRAVDLSNPLAESPPESRLRLQLVLAGLSPVPQYEVRDAAGRFLARVDLAFPAAKVAVEYDGRAVHEQEGVFARDRQRQNALVRAGWIVLRFTAADLRFGAVAVIAHVAAAVAGRAA